MTIREDGAILMTLSNTPGNRSRRGRLAACVLLSLACLGVRAETVAEKLETARQLVEVMEYRAMYDSAKAQCASEKNALFDPAEMLENNPAAFRGITAGSAYWPEIQAVYRRYQLRTCASLSAEDFTRFMMQQFAERTSLDDLRVALAFYATPAGRRLQRAGVEANSAFQAYSGEAYQKAVLEADKQTQQEVVAIIRRYLHEPR